MSLILSKLPKDLQDTIVNMKDEMEKNEYATKFGNYIEGRQKHNDKMNEMNRKYKDVRMPFGKYKGYSLLGLALYQENHIDVGKNYLRWVSKNVDIKDKLLKEAVEFYKRYYYLHTDGYD